jgi:hypothetical protein
MRIIFVCDDDYANFGFLKSESLKSVGINSDAYVLTKHPFGYDKCATLVSQEEMKYQIGNADIINIVHSCPTAFRLSDGADGKKFVWHTGTRYRQSHNRYNEIFQYAHHVFYALGEFESLCKSGSTYVSVTVDTDELAFTQTNNDKLMIGHYPSNAQVKGTETICKVIGEINSNKFVFNCDTTITTYPLSIARLRKCDIYIEMCASTQGGKPYGSFGTTAVEAASLGKIVITNSLWESCYKNQYGEHSLIIANSPDELKDKLIWLIGLPIEEINEMKLASREWAVKSHGYKQTAETLLHYYL